MMDTVNNPVFVVGVVLAVIIVAVFLLKVFGSAIRAVFWKPKRRDKYRIGK